MNEDWSTNAPTTITTPSATTTSRRLKKVVSRVLIALSFGASRRSGRDDVVDVDAIKEALAISSGSKTTLRTTLDALEFSRPSNFALEHSASLSNVGSSSTSEDENNIVDLCKLSPQHSLRSRRKAIFDPKSLGFRTMASNNERASPTASIDELEQSVTGHTRKRQNSRKRSSADLGLHYPGDLLSQVAAASSTSGPRRSRRRDRPLLKRHTIEEFANTKAFQESTASLISASEQDKRLKSAFSLLKLIEKRSTRGGSKDNTRTFSEVLQSLKRSEFEDTYLLSYKKAHWTDLIANKLEENEGSEEEDDDNVRKRQNDRGMPIVNTDVTSGPERKRREAVWELFTSECVFLIDHLMVLKHCFMEPLKQMQVEGHLMFVEPQDLFGNLDEVCSVSYTFCREFISFLLEASQASDFGSTDVLTHGLHRFCELTRDGEVYHDYCLNYSKAMTCLDQLRKNDEFCEFEKWCEQDPRCHRLLLTDLLISPMQHCTKVPLLLNNICRFTETEEDQQQLIETLRKLELSLQNLEAKMNWLKNFERVQEIQQQLVWPSISELEPRSFIPEFLKSVLNRQPCDRILSGPKRKLLHEGPVALLEVSKLVDMYMFLFDDILLLTRVKKQPKKKLPAPSGESTSIANSSYGRTPVSKARADSTVFVVHRQPIALDRFTVYDVRPADVTAASSPYTRNAFVIVQITRFQQVIGVYTLQAPSQASKETWLTCLPEAQEKFSAYCRSSAAAATSSSTSPSPSSAVQSSPNSTSLSILDGGSNQRIRLSSSSGSQNTVVNSLTPVGGDAAKQQTVLAIDTTLLSQKERSPSPSKSPQRSPLSSPGSRTVSPRLVDTLAPPPSPASANQRETCKTSCFTFPGDVKCVAVGSSSADILQRHAFLSVTSSLLTASNGSVAQQRSASPNKVSRAFLMPPNPAAAGHPALRFTSSNPLTSSGAWRAAGVSGEDVGIDERRSNSGDEEEGDVCCEEAAGAGLSRFKARSMYDRQQRSKLKTIREKSQSTDAIINNSDCT